MVQVLYVANLREELGMPQMKAVRQFSEVAELPPGVQAQVNIGEQKLPDMYGSSVKALAIGGVTQPAAGAVPVSTVIETAQYTGTVTWSPNDNPFDYNTQYIATITLLPKAGDTLTGVAANSFTVADAVSVAHSADSGVIIAAFPTTGSVPNTIYHNPRIQRRRV